MSSVGVAPGVGLLFVISGLGAGGAERMLFKVASRLSASFRPTVVSLTDRDFFGPEFERIGIPVHALGMRGPLSAPHAVLALANLMRRLKPDVVSTWMYHGDLVGGLAARLAGIRGVAWNIRNSDLSATHSSRGTRMVVNLNARLSRSLPATILCCSETARRIHVALGYDDARFSVIPNGFDLDQYRPDPEARAAVRAELGIPEGAPLVGLVARWHPQKDHRTFVAAAARVRREMPEAHFVLAGEGCDPANPVLDALLAEAGVKPGFRLLGLRTDVPRITAALDLAVSSSAFGEAFPNVLGEAMACAVPCVATDVGDSAHIVADTGLVVAPRQPEALAVALLRMLRLDAAERLARGQAARERVSAMFDLGSITNRYEDVFHGLAHSTRAGTPCAA